MIHSAPARSQLRSKSGATELPRDRLTDFHFLPCASPSNFDQLAHSSKRFARSFYYHLKETHLIACLHDHTRNDLITNTIELVRVVKETRFIDKRTEERQPVCVS